MLRIAKIPTLVLASSLLTSAAVASSFCAMTVVHASTKPSTHEAVIRLVSADVSKTTKSTEVAWLRLPLYRGASSRKLSSVPLVQQGAGNGLAGSRAYLVRANAHSVASWYRKVMQQGKWQAEPAGQAGTESGHITQVYDSMVNPSLTVELDFVPRANHEGQLYIEYFATEAQSPPRPSGTIVPTDVARIAVKYLPASTKSGGTWQTKSITKTTEIRQIVFDVNHLFVDTRTNVTAETSLYGGATLRLVTTSGKVIPVRVFYNRNQVQVGGGPALFDGQNEVWTTLAKDLGFAPYPQQ